MFLLEILCMYCCAEMEKRDLNTYIGDMGPYQWRVFITVFIFAIYAADAIHIIFIAGKMPHWCRVPELDDLPYDIQKNVAIPAHDGKYSSCEMYSLNYSIYNHSDFYTWNRSLMMADEMSIAKCSQWTYDQSQFLSTIVSKVRCLQICERIVKLRHQFCALMCNNIKLMAGLYAVLPHVGSGAVRIGPTPFPDWRSQKAYQIRV